MGRTQRGHMPVDSRQDARATSGENAALRFSPVSICVPTLIPQ